MKMQKLTGVFISLSLFFGSNGILKSSSNEGGDSSADIITPSNYHVINTWDNLNIPQGTCRAINFSNPGSADVSSGSCPSTITYGGVLGYAIYSCELSEEDIIQPFGSMVFYDTFFSEEGHPHRINLRQAINMCNQLRESLSSL